MKSRILSSHSGDLPADGPGQIFYDAECPFCVSWARRFSRTLSAGGFELAPLQTPGAARLLRIPEADLMQEMRLLRADGATFGGADAIVEISRRIWWATPLWLLASVPGVLSALRAGYRALAARRDCVDGNCLLPNRRTLGAGAFLPLLVLPGLAFLLRDKAPAWVFMWALAWAIFLGCKWLSYAEARAQGLRPSLARTLSYLVAWPGMDGKSFLNDSEVVKPTPLEWASTAAKIVLGAAILAAAALAHLPVVPLVTGWLGMTGAVLMLHFGSFHLLSLVWRSAGVNALPLMRRPLHSTTLAEFWGRRWNTAFHDLAARYTFHPLRRVFPPALAALLVFVTSGLVHDLVISVPARGGYGLPTLYFLIQGIGTAVERRFGWKSRTFTLAVVAAPAIILFHPPFVHNVILPMLSAIGGLLRNP